ncbi:hypothetical protein [Kitasatospora sp. McL0602]|uniref:hypothetical protein n=1 Tax=Kitasatospora sp. McL0602 TaxID=3439530 RepID=UPI003F8CD797
MFLRLPYLALTSVFTLIRQTRLALVTAFADPNRAIEEIELARQLLERLDQRATVLLTHVAALVAVAGTDDREIADRVAVLRTQIDVAGLPWLTPLRETAVALHHAVCDDQDGLAAALDRLREATANGDFAYYLDVAHYMADLPLPVPSTTHWLGDEAATRSRWRSVVTTRQNLAP